MCASRDETNEDFLKAMSVDTLRKMNAAINDERADIAAERAELGWGDVSAAADMYFEVTDLFLAGLKHEVMTERGSRPA